MGFSGIRAASGHHSYHGNYEVFSNRVLYTWLDRVSCIDEGTAMPFFPPAAEKIRDVRIDDLNGLLELNQSNLPHLGSISMSGMEHLHRQAVYFHVAEFVGQTAGFLIAFDPQADYNSLNFQWFKKRYNSFVYIDRIAVAPDLRRKGIAFSLYQNLEHFAVQHNIPIMTCEYNLQPKNEISRQFHQKYGFKEVGTQKTENGKKTASLQIKAVTG